MHTRYGEGDQSDGPPPIVIDLGKATGDSLSQLRHGKGRLMDDVAAVIKQIQEEAGAALAGALGGSFLDTLAEPSRYSDQMGLSKARTT